jgi:hypothetical protein
VEKDIVASDISEPTPLNEMAGSGTSTASEVEEGPTNVQYVSQDVEEGPQSVQEPVNIQGPTEINR